MATWSGTTPYATKKQLVSSISGLYDDLQDLSGFQFQNLEVSTLSVKNWISVPILYVSSIEGAKIDLSGVLFADALSTSIANFQFTAVSSIQFVVNPSFSVSFNAKEALFGALSGLGFMIFETLLGAGAGTGLALKGLGEGIAAMIMARGTNTYINNTHFELLNGATQLQVSTLGNAYPLYSSITRYVSSISGNQVPGAEMFVSTFFNPGTTCIRSISDPFPIPSSNPNIATSTLQMFGEWVPLPFDDNTTFLALSNTTDQPLFTLNRTTTSNNMPMIDSLQNISFINDFNFPYDSNALPYSTNLVNVSYHRDEYTLNNTYISTPYIRFQSTLTITAPDPYFIRSTISTPCEFTWNGTNGYPGGDFAICEPDETSFRSTATMDFIANTTDLFIQWGLAVNNHNSTIAAGTAKRVSWDIDANTSNFINIPQAVSTTTNEATQQIFGYQTNPHEIIFQTLGTGMNPSRLAFNIQAATFGSDTTLKNQSNYPYQFNSNVYVNGTMEVQTLIALSSIFSISTFVDTQISTQSVLADYIETPELYAQEGFISTLKASSNWTNDYISMKSRVRMMGYQTPLAIITGRGSNFYDTGARFDFVTDTIPQAVYVESQPANITLMRLFSTNVEIPNLTVENLTAENIVYSNADVPNLQTSTINFGWTGNFNTLVTPKFSLQQSLTTEPGLFWNTYTAASNQTLNIMAFSNTVNMLAQPFSTPLIYVNTELDGQNRDGWASTILYNAQTTPARVYLAPNAGNGEVSLQAQTFNVVALMNQSQQAAGLGSNVPVPVGSTYKFTSDGTSWTTNCNAPNFGTIQYNNAFQMTMDFENLNISTTDTLNLNAETINLNGQVVMPNAQMSNLYLNQFLSANQIYLNTDPATDSAINVLRTYTGNQSGQGTANPFNITNTVNSTDFINIKNTLNPNRGFNMFNSYNVNEWNNNSYVIDLAASSGLPYMILGDVILKSPPFTPYSGQFYINNTLDSPGSNIPLYLNKEGLLSTIGYAASNQYTRVYTNDGTTWSIQSNVANPIANGGTYSNFYTMAMNATTTSVQVGMPLVETMPSRQMTTNKIIMDCPQIRVFTYESPSFVSREAGFELNSYFDANVIFNENAPTQSDALNPILNSLSNLYYPVCAWSAQIWISRIRTESFGIQGYDIDPIPLLVSGTAGDFIWASARYLNVNGTPASITANIRENYFMTPKNYHTAYGWLTQ